jgi:hypothetical protein
MKSAALLGALAALAATGIGAGAAEQPSAAPLIVHYNLRPPLHYATPQGALTGFAAKPVIDALTAAGIPYEIRQTPAKRQLALLHQQGPQEPACMMSWLEAPGRERYGKFSAVIYQDKRPFALTWAGNKDMENEEPLKDTLSNPRLRLLVKEGFSYGPAIDRALIRHKTASTSTTGEARQMLEMLQRRRIDYFFITEEEADDAFAATGYAASGFKRIYFSDMTQGYDRHLWCTKTVPDDTLKRFNAALAKQRR